MSEAANGSWFEIGTKCAIIWVKTRVGLNLLVTAPEMYSVMKRSWKSPLKKIVNENIIYLMSLNNSGLRVCTSAYPDKSCDIESFRFACEHIWPCPANSLGPPCLVCVRGTCWTYLQKKNFTNSLPWRWVRAILVKPKKLLL